MIRFISVIFLAISLLAYNEAPGQGRKKRAKMRQTAITTAKSYIGTPYRYGGNTRSGIDCSGLIHNSFKAAGVKVPRTAKEQSKVGSNQSWNSLKPGDIVTFKFKEKREKWYHSGMITSVKGTNIKFVHASTSRGVVESSLNSDYYKKNVKKFRRVIR